MRIAIQCYPSLCYLMYLGTPICSAMQCFYQFVLVFIYCLLSLFSDTAGNKHSLLEFQQKVPFLRVIFKKSIPISLQLKKYYVTFKKKNMQLRFKISMADASRYQLMTKDKLPVFRVQLKIFTRFMFKLVLRVSGRSVSWDIPLTLKHTVVHNLHVIFKCCL